MTDISPIELQSLSPSTVIELFEMDATELGGEVLYFHAGTNELSQNITWNGQVYVRYPIKISGFELSGDGAFPRPKLAVSNALSAITLVLQLYQDLIGAKVTRRRTLKKFLDAVNFTGGVNPDEDMTAEFPVDIYFIDRKSQESRELVEFELASSIDLAGIKLPRRQIIQNVCSWRYRSTECGYTGAPLWDINDDMLLQSDVTSSEAKAVLTLKASLDAAYLTFVEAQRNLSIKNSLQGNACEYKLTDNLYELESGVQTALDNNPNKMISITEDIKYGAATIEASGRVTPFGEWNSAAVTIGNTYRIGRFKRKVFAIYRGRVMETSLYAIERWAIDTVGCNAAEAERVAALAARNAAQVAYLAALALYEAALAELDEDDQIYAVERCGKRLSSCKLRFGESDPLPFGSFPSASLVK